MANDFEQFKKQVEQKRKLIARHTADLKTLLLHCTHEEVTEKSKYFPGSYYDTAHTEYWNECVVCHKTFNKHYSDHGYYQ